jgi:DNA-binding PadR family transcriptional regulator
MPPNWERDKVSKTSEKCMKTESGIAKVEAGDVRRLFPKYKEFFEFVAKQGFDQVSFSEYFGDAASTQRNTPIPFPERFTDLVADHPGKYFVVAYEDRRDPYYAVGTRGRAVRLSTVQRKTESDRQIREIEIREVDPNEGNFIDTTVTESLNNRKNVDRNTGGDAEVEPSTGRAKFIYRINDQGKKTLREMKIVRLDEGVFNFGNVPKAVRWVRDLDIDATSAESTLEYVDRFIIGRSTNITQEERADVKTIITGTLEIPGSITVNIGLGAPSEGRVLFEDAERKIRVVLYPAMRGSEKQLDVAKNDPVYAPLFEDPMDGERFLEGIRGRITMLKEEWNNPQSVYQPEKSITGSPTPIEEGNN